MHFPAGGGREEDDGDDCRKVSGVASGCNYREPTAGCSQVDENEAAGQLCKVFGRQTVLEVTVSVEMVKDSSSTYEETMEDHKASEQANHLSSGNAEFAILLCKK